MSLYNDLFKYDPTSPTFLRNKITRNNKAKAGAPSGCFGNGYGRVVLDRKVIGIATVIWEMHNGPIPDGMIIGYVDGDSTNLLIENLFIQSQRKKSYTAAKKKYTGVVEVNGSFHTYVKVDGKRTYVGQYSTELKAKNARNRFVELLGVK